MVTESKPRIKITYATLRADNEDLYRRAIERIELGPPVVSLQFCDQTE